jgi:DNA-directed RNA polymerase specialized sigma24 family protein
MNDGSINDAMERRLREWGSWLANGTRTGGFPTKNVLHESWMPPAPGSRPTLAVGGRDDGSERELHGLIGQLSIRAANTLIVVYVLKLRAAEQAIRLECRESTIRARVLQAKRRLLRQIK